MSGRGAMVARWAAALLLAGSALAEAWGIPGEWAYSTTAMQRAPVRPAEVPR